jgi:neutral ceramidase
MRLYTVASVWLILSVLSGAAAAEFRVGRAAVKITPPAGIPMAGYYSVRLAEGTHDDLYAKALVFEKDGTKAALVACDLIGIDRYIVDGARKAIEAGTGVPGESVMISATHSHTGPLLNPRFLAAAQGEPLRIAKQYIAALPNKIAEAVKLAEVALIPAEAQAGTGREESLSFNRRFLMKDGTVRFNPGKLNPEIVQPVGPIDPEVGVAYFESAGKPLATYVNFALHLDTVGGTQFSADYPYTLGRLLARVKAPDMLTMFTIGTAGNINHVDVKSRDPQKGTGEAARIGTVLAGEVIKTYTRLKPVRTDALRVKREIVELPVAKLDAGADAKAREMAAKFGKPDQPPFLDMVNALKVLDVMELDGRPLRAEVQVIALGDQIAWVGLPGEIFVELGTAIKKASPFPNTMVVELANGSISYVPNRKAYNEGAYEVISARTAAGGGEMLAEAAIRLLAALGRGQ